MHIFTWLYYDFKMDNGYMLIKSIVHQWLKSIHVAILYNSFLRYNDYIPTSLDLIFFGDKLTNLSLGASI